MRIVFLGATGFGLRCLDAVRPMPEIDIVGVVTAPAQFPISYRPEGVTNVLYADFEDYSRAHAIPCAVIEDGMRGDALRETAESWRPDIFLVAGWYHMVPKRWRAIAPAFGMHASLLPDYSGGAPLVWAMIEGEEKTGITLFQLGDGVDDGPILGQAETPILPEDDIASLYARIENLGIELLRRHLPELAAGTARLLLQDESKRRIVPQRAPEDGLIDWTLPAARIHDFIRAQTKPYPGAFTMEGSRKVTIWASRPSDQSAPAPGASAGGPDRLVFGSGDGRGIEVTAVAIDGADSDIGEYWSMRGQGEGEHGFA